MNRTSKKIIKSLLLTAALSVLHTKAEAVTPNVSSIDGSEGNKDNGEIELLKQRVFKNILKMSPSGKIYQVDSHRSHSSHRSHRSSSSGHNSHYSSSHTSHYSSSHYSSSSVTGSHSSTSSSSSKSSSSSVSSGFYSSPTAKTYSTYVLGDRGLNVGLYGKDVDELVARLKSYYYLSADYSNKENGFYKYDAKVKEAVKHFQRDAELKETGSFGSEEKAALDKWDYTKTTIELGIRELSVFDSGHDVEVLIELLAKAGYPIEISSIIVNDSTTAPNTMTPTSNLYTDEVVEAIKAFQAFSGLAVTGVANKETIQKLKTAAR